MVDIDANVTNTRGRPRDATLVVAVNPDGTPIGSGGGGSTGGATEATQAEILMTLSELEQDVGHAEDAAWSGSGPGTLIAVTKAVYVQQQTMIALLQQIRDNTMAS